MKKGWKRLVALKCQQQPRSLHLPTLFQCVMLCVIYLLWIHVCQAQGRQGVQKTKFCILQYLPCSHTHTARALKIETKMVLQEQGPDCLSKAVVVQLRWTELNLSVEAEISISELSGQLSQTLLLFSFLVVTPVSHKDVRNLKHCVLCLAFYNIEHYMHYLDTCQDRA